MAQKVERQNPILFADIFVGGAGAAVPGFGGGYQLNYQSKAGLFALRLVSTISMDIKGRQLGPFLAFPTVDKNTDFEEYAFLYGYRYIRNNMSVSFLTGISNNLLTTYYYNESLEELYDKEIYAGLPYEFDIKFFKATKRRFRIYGLIPVGPKTAFGGSIGFKLFGNFSRRNYVGLGVNYGLGYHKKY